LKKQPADRMVCFCYSVAESEIVKAIQEGATSLMDVRRKTLANTGCGGCGEEVKKLLRKHAGSTPPAGET
jgi:NAD(P)H-nitrite reductase large subunit